MRRARPTRSEAPVGGEKSALGVAALVLVFVVTGCGGQPPSITEAPSEPPSITEPPSAKTDDEAQLWMPPERQRSEGTVDRWITERAIHFASVNEAQWRVPEDPDWSEDPFRSNAWLFRYHSLRWLQAVALAASASDDDSHLEEAKRLLLDWIVDNPRKGAPSHRSWYDHAVASRTDTMVWLYREHLHDRLAGAELERFLESLEEHGRVLRQYLDEPRFEGHNHNLFHALSLHNLAAIFPSLPAASEWKDRARDRISELLREMVNESEGVSTEQAAVYHTLALRLFLDAHRYLLSHGDGLSDSDLTILGRMVRFGLLLRRSDGSLPAIGDTRYGQGQNLPLYERALQIVDDDPVARFLLSGGEVGSAPPETSVFSRTGWAIFRPDGDAAHPDMHVVVRFGPEPRLRSHGHHDHGSFTLFSHGLPWIVDTGGPYRYDHPIRADIEAPWAHNRVIAEHLEPYAAESPVLDWGDSSDLIHLTVRVDLGSDVVHTRTLVIVKPDTVVVLDRVRGAGREAGELSLLYHLAPGVDVSRTRDGTYIATQDDRSIELDIVASGPLRLERRSAQRRPQLLGYVTENLKDLTPAPVVSGTQDAAVDSWFLTVIRDGGTNEPSVDTVQTRDGTFVVDLGVLGELVLPVDSNPVLRAGGQ